MHLSKQLCTILQSQSNLVRTGNNTLLTVEQACQLWILPTAQQRHSLAVEAFLKFNGKLGLLVEQVHSIFHLLLRHLHPLFYISITRLCHGQV